MVRKPSSRGLLVLAAVVVFAGLLIGAAGGEPGGALDPTFGVGGRVMVDYGQSEEFQDVAVQPDGRVVAAGHIVAADGSNSGLLIRLNQDGTPDATFGDHGRVVTPFVAYKTSLALQVDGRILFGGAAFTDLDQPATKRADFSVARYNADGSPDLAFGTDGRVTTDLGASEGVLALLVQPDGKTVAVGYSYTGFYPNHVFHLALARYLPDGRLDPGFGENGTLISDLASIHASGAALTSDGKVVIAAARMDGDSLQPGVVLSRYASDGRLDPTFDGDGIVTEPGGSPGGVAIEPDARVLVASSGADSLLRYQPDGQLDPTFGGDGRVSVPNRLPAGGPVAVQANGKVVTFGVLQGAAGPGFAVGRVLPDGSVDPTFRTKPPADTSPAPWEMALGPHGQIIGVGGVGEGNRTDAVALRYLPGTCSVPALQGKTLAAAQAKITAGNCRVGTLRKIASKRVKRGRVISQSPAAGREVEDWALVNLVISRGRK